MVMPSRTRHLATLLLFFFSPLLIAAQEIPDYWCKASRPCSLGCCGPIDSTTGYGVCGMGPTFCGTACTGQCTAKSDCDPGWGMQWTKASKCPLNVCCSEYGFCGTTADFCAGNAVASPQCDVSTRTSDGRTIGYYEGWNWQRPCGTMTPDQIPLGIYTHIFFSFALINPNTFRLTHMDDVTGSLYKQVSALKRRDPDLQVWIAIGGWAFNDPGPTRTTFSDLARSESAQNEFFESLATFLEDNHFDGVDLDWEYPGAEDRGGRGEDFENFPRFLQRLRARLNRMSTPQGLSVTLPASYWYLQGFDIVNLEPHLDFFNVMTYDIHGTWDSNVTSIGSYAYAHTNLTEINSGLELLWRNNINPQRVTLGLGFYGRSFTMSNPSCMSPGCPFNPSAGARAGRCTGVEGVLSAAEIFELIDNGAQTTLDVEGAVMIATWESNQWVSYDNAQTLGMKINYANKRCLGGLMVWAIDLDDGRLVDALGESLGRAKRPELPQGVGPSNCFGPSKCLMCESDL